MYRLTARQKTILTKKIRHYKNVHFPGKGGGSRLAGEVGVPPQTLSNWLSGSRRPTFIQLYRLAITFNVSPLELCGIQRDKSPLRNDADISILHDILSIMREAEKGNANPRITAKVMNDIKVLIEQAILELE